MPADYQFMPAIDTLPAGRGVLGLRLSSVSLARPRPIIPDMEGSVAKKRKAEEPVTPFELLRAL